MKKAIFIFGLVLSLNLLALPNPASVNCVSKGTLPEIVKLPDSGEIGICDFKHGTIEEWTLYNYNNGKESKAVAAYLKQEYLEIPPMVRNPWDIYCGFCGGNLVKVTTTYRIGENFSFNMCQFDDKSMIEVLTLYRGQYAEVNKRLTTALGK